MKTILKAGQNIEWEKYQIICKLKAETVRK